MADEKRLPTPEEWETIKQKISESAREFCENFEVGMRSAIDKFLAESEPVIEAMQKFYAENEIEIKAYLASKGRASVFEDGSDDED